MTATPGPITLIVVTLYCRTTEAVCEHYKESWLGETCLQSAGRLIDCAIGEIRVTPDWCHLKGETT